ncbi:MAG TPA: hypothetical protein VFG08_02120 [Candidatus Polarisedimenticolia bacterium]|nr:hypothetical protein [Candidatus Polarisedimenticolia bacterium]
MRRALTFALLLPLAMACDSDNGGTPAGPPTGPTIPTIGGTYSAGTMWQFEQVPVSGAATTVLTCSGGLTIASQLADSFSGTFFVQDATCGTASGGVTGGTLSTDGAVTFALTSATDASNFLLAAFGCTYVSGDTVMTGTITGNNLRARSSTRMTCPAGEITLNVTIDGNRP